ncbi:MULTISPECIES: AMP-binding protein [unclassified Pseudonocardia]|uniref:AMP-binding protein n=1 Tax=unclassified Pseudonocardia TaxID=2619320 RepID=UPI000AE746B2|nr:MULTISPECIES: AMP-binding protein [unclassified Pseudonocardia]
MDLLGKIDVTTLRGRRAVNRWERTAVGDVFERLTWSYPDATAVTGRPGAYGEERFASVTYRQADEIACQVAHALAGRGLEPGARVVLFCENSVEAYLAKIGIAKAGMVAMPINPSLATDVLEHLIAQAEPGLAIVDAELWPRAEEAFTGTGLRVGATVTIGGGPVAGSPPSAASSTATPPPSPRSRSTATTSGSCSTRRGPRRCRRA